MIWVLSIIGAVLYRLGGLKGFNTKIRDLGVPLIGGIAVYALAGKMPLWAVSVAFLGYFGALTSYYDFINGEDNFWIHGFVGAFSYFPYAIVTGLWFMFAVRCIICAVFIGGINYIANKYSWKHSDWIEELSRGFILTLSIGLLY